MLYRNPALLIEKLGETYTIRRASVAAGANSWTAGVATITYLAAKGTRRIDLPHGGPGLARDAQSIAIFSPDYNAPVQGDRVAYGTIASDVGIEWHEVVHVDTVRIEGQIAKYYCYLRD